MAVSRSLSRIATQDERRPFASATAIKDGRFVGFDRDKAVMSHF